VYPHADYTAATANGSRNAHLQGPGVRKKTFMTMSLLQEKQAYRKAFDQVFVAMAPSSAKSIKKTFY
jgi:hypothetical protein